jgi:hypothetical protein
MFFTRRGEHGADAKRDDGKPFHKCAGG